MISIYNKEITSYLNTFIGYLTIGIFLIISGLLVWVFPEMSILDGGYATLDSFFNIAPYLFLFLIPAICMRSIAGEKADGTFDLLLSKPITFSDIIIGKYLAAYTIALVAILMTSIYPISLYFISNPVGNIDVGGIIGSYIGLAFLALAFSAIGIFSSCLTKNPIIAFLLAVVICFFFYYGFDAISQFQSLYRYEDFIASFGIEFHYQSLSRGLITAQDCFYFLSISYFFITLSIGHIGRKFRNRKKTLTVYLFSLVTIFVFNHPLITNLLGRLDFTEDKRYTLSNTSKDIVKDVKENIHITIFLDGNLPSGFKRLQQAAIDLAHDIKSYANGHIKVNVINPQAGTQQEQNEIMNALIERGIQPTNLSVRKNGVLTQNMIFPAAIVNLGEKEININLLQNRLGLSSEDVLNNSIQNLEFGFISAIKKVLQDSKPYIGFTEGHGEPSDLELYDAMQTFSLTNQVGRINLDSIQIEDIDKFSVIIIAKPKTKFSESDKYKLDYFIRKGGSVVWAIDQIDASLDNLKASGSQILLGRELNIDDQLFLYGVRFNYDLVADMNCSQIPLNVGMQNNQPQIQLVPWKFYPIIMPNNSNSITKNLDGIYTEFIGTLDTIANPTIQKTILLETSPYSKIFKTGSSISLQMVDEDISPNTMDGKKYPFGILLSGKFPYLFENRPTPQGIKAPIDLSNISNPAKMFVIADGDWLTNQINTKDNSPYPLGWNKFTEQQFANKTFLENIVDYLTNDEKLISLRNKEVKLRLLSKSTIQNQQLKWQAINILVPLLALAIFGFVQQGIRKRKYNKKPQ